MKCLIISIVLLIGLGLIIAVSNDTESALTFKKDVENILKNISSTKVAEVNWYRDTLLGLIGEVLSEFEAAKTRLGDKLSALGDEGNALKADLQSNISSLIKKSSKNTFTLLYKTDFGIKAVYKIVGIKGISEVKIRNDTETVKSLINVSDNGTQCWDQDMFIAISNKMFMDIHSELEQQLAQLNGYIMENVNATSSITSEIEEKLDEFGSDDANAINYVTNNRLNLSKTEHFFLNFIDVF